MRTRQIGASPGVIGPAIFVATSLFGGRIQPGYSALSDYVSALSLGDHGWMQIASFLQATPPGAFSWHGPVHSLLGAMVFTKSAVDTKNPDLVAVVAADAGLLQRLVIIPSMAWIALFGASLSVRT